MVNLAEMITSPDAVDGSTEAGMIAPHSFLIQATNNLIAMEAEPFYEDDWLTLYFNTRCESNLKIEKTNDGFKIVIGAATNNITSTDPEELIGSWLIWSRSNRHLRLISDILGTEVIYYQITDAGTWISNRIENCNLKNEQVDYSSIQQYLYTGYTTEKHTFFKDVLQTRPNETIAIEIGDKIAQNVSDTVAPGFDTDRKTDIADALTAAILKQPASALMMSAGWDSRTLLATKKPPYQLAYTHGDLSSREISLSQKITGTYQLNHNLHSLKQYPINYELLDKMLRELGHCVFPIWYLASINIQKDSSVPISSGVLGELLGGHYGILSLGSKRNKISKAVQGLLNIHQSRATYDSALENFFTPPTNFWFTSKAFQIFLNEQSEETKNRSWQTFKKLEKSTESVDLAIEQFNMEHRARQYILKQAQGAKSTSGYCAPFADARLVKGVQKIPFHKRVHNKLNRELLGKSSPNLINYPMAATLVSAKRPIIIQEASRVVRVVKEKIASTQGKSIPLGWFNYDHLYESTCLQDIVNTLKSDIWDLERMQTTLKNNPSNSIDAGSTLDMLCKIKTVDWILENAKKNDSKGELK